ncbi:hypothetical protein [Kutzneria sp. 744]|uniref:hypothetical protein n=1 Tax=Kutzneria sp. (strain 744) TaxID=345341 RepID=UPI0003EEC318|nr:hypothetical protein [Kutzneria sp. 744]EWM13530.1 LigA protein [Kutzneria sp. 744]
MSKRAVLLAVLTAVTAIVTVAAPAGAATPATRFTAVTPQRVLDTRDGTGVGVEGDHLVLDLSGSVPAGTAAVVLNLTGVEANVDSFVTVWPDGQQRPSTSNLNVSQRQTAANLTTVSLPDNRKLDIAVRGDLGVVADLQGYYAGNGSGYVGHSPQRVMDTRTGRGPLGPHESTVLDLSSVLPPTATAVVFNLTATNTTAPTFVTAWPDGVAQPAASSLNLAPGWTRANLVTVAVPPSRKIDLYNHLGSVDLIADVSGFYVSDAGDWFFPGVPQRVVDTRDSHPVGPGGVLAVDVSPQTVLSADAVAVNITATDATTSTFLTAWPGDSTRPDASTLNLGAGETVPNMAIVSLWQRSFSVSNLAGSVDVVVDIAGYFSANRP